MKSASCFCVGRGDIGSEQVEKLCTLLEVTSGRKPKAFKSHEYVLQSAVRNPNTMWVEHNLGASSAGKEGSTSLYKLCCSGRMRSAVQVKGNVGQIKSLTEESLECDTREKLLCFLEDLNLSVRHNYVKEGYVFLLMEKGAESLLFEQTENKFQVFIRVVQLKMHEEVEGVEAEEEVFPGKWLVELFAKASGADYSQAITHFEKAATKISSLVQIQATK